MAKNSYIDLKFKELTAEQLKEKLQPSIDKYGLSAKYKDGIVRIFGEQSALNEIFHAYSVQYIKHLMVQALNF